MNLHGNGAIDSAYTENDYIYGNICGISKTDLPPKFLNNIRAVKNQYNTMKCVGFSFASLMEIRSMMTKNTKNVPELSPQFVYYQSKLRDELSKSTAGTTLKAACEVLHKIGVCTEAFMPFKQDNDLLDGMTKPSNSAIDDAKPRVVDGYARIYTLDEIKKAVYLEGGCAISMRYYSSMLQCKNGYMKKPSSIEKPIGNHCKLIIGYDDTLEKFVNGIKYKGFFVMLNSYGTTHGDKGLEYVPYDCLSWTGINYSGGIDKLFREAFVLYDNSNVNNKKFHIENQPDTVIKSLTKINLEFKLESKIAIVDGKEVKMDIAPVNNNGSTFLPFRFIFETMGCDVYFNKENGQSVIKGIDRESFRLIEMTLGSKIAYINKQRYIMPKAPFIKDNRTLVPLRAVAEMLGCDVNFDNITKKITINRD